MPNYDYRCTKCAAAWEVALPMSEREEPIGAECPECKEGVLEQYLPYAPGFAYDHLNVRKRVPEAFKDVLRNIKTKHLHNTINV